MKQQTITLRGQARALAAPLSVGNVLAAVQPSLADQSLNFGAGVQTVNPRVGHPDSILPSGFSLRLLAHGEDPIERRRLGLAFKAPAAWA